MKDRRLLGMFLVLAIFLGMMPGALMEAPAADMPEARIEEAGMIELGGDGESTEVHDGDEGGLIIVEEESPAVELVSESEEAMAAADQYVPRNLDWQISGSDKRSMNLGDTLRITIANADEVVAWRSDSRKLVPSIAVKNGVAKVKPIAAGTAKLRVKVKLGDREKVYTIKLKIVDPLVPTAIAFTKAMKDSLREGATLKLSDCIKLTPAYAKADISFSVTGAAKLAKDGVTLTATKAGKATITATSKVNSKVKATFRLVVLANEIDKLCSKPGKQDIAAVAGGWTLWPYAVDASARGGIQCRLCLINGAGQKTTKLRNMTLTLTQNGKRLARHKFDSVNAAVEKGGPALIRVTFPAASCADPGSFFLPDGGIGFTVDANADFRLAAGTRTFGYMPTKIPFRADGTAAKVVKLSAEALTLVEGKSATLTATVLPVNRYVRWASSNEDVATVVDGTVRARGAGSAVITAAALGDGSVKAECAVTVTAAPNPAIQKLDQKLKGFTRVEDVLAALPDTDRLMAEARQQYKAEDYTKLSSPVKYHVLWLAYPRVTYKDLDFRMTDFDREYLRAVALNYEKVIERLSNYNVNIDVDLHFISESRELTKQKDEDGDWLWLAKKTVRKDIDRYLDKKDYDAVLTTVQTAGEANEKRNAKSPNKELDVILGLCTDGIQQDIGYSTFKLGEPRPNTYPLKDPKIPSLYATAVAVHEWMHQLDNMGEELNIIYPPTHAYMGPKAYPGYRAYEADKNNYDYFEFYELVLGGRVVYTKNGKSRHVGMFPKMWPLARRNWRDLSRVAIVNEAGEYLSCDPKTRALTLSEKECLWNIRYSSDNSMIIMLYEHPDYRIDLDNDWDDEGNSVNLRYEADPEYLTAQEWMPIRNPDESFSILTVHDSRRAITIEKPGDQAAIRADNDRPSSAQKWFFYVEK